MTIPTTHIDSLLASMRGAPLLAAPHLMPMDTPAPVDGLAIRETLQRALCEYVTLRMCDGDTSARDAVRQADALLERVTGEVGALRFAAAGGVR